MKPNSARTSRSIQYGLTAVVLICALCVYSVKTFANDVAIEIDASDVMSQAEYQATLNNRDDSEITLHGAQAGIAHAQAKMALLYEQGDKVKQSDEEALFWFQMAANQDHPQAQYNLGLMLLDGRGAEQDLAGSEYWIERAALQDYLPAILHLARGANIHSPLQEQELQWLTTAAEMGDAVSQLQLGYYYLGQYSLGHNLSKAEFWLNNAAKHGLYDAQSALIELYTLSIYQMEDEELAHHWRQIAALSAVSLESDKK
ncbi:tetratricopeptide repeat protein [Vibrio astriarenae]|jgi:TPR repeat protein